MRSNKALEQLRATDPEVLGDVRQDPGKRPQTKSVMPRDGHVMLPAVGGCQPQMAARLARDGIPYASAGFAPGFGKSYLSSVDEAIERGIKKPNYEVAVASLRSEQTLVAASLEEAKIEAEAKAEAAAREKAWNEKLIADEQRAIHAREKEQRDEIVAEAQRREELAAAHLSRRARGVA